MSKEAAVNFFNKLATDEALLKSVQGATKVSEIAAIAKASGFDFTDAEFEAADQPLAGGALSDSQLEAVAGGAGTNPAPLAPRTQTSSCKLTITSGSTGCTTKVL